MLQKTEFSEDEKKLNILFYVYLSCPYIHGNLTPFLSQSISINNSKNTRGTGIVEWKMNYHKVEHKLGMFVVLESRLLQQNKLSLHCLCLEILKGCIPVFGTWRTTPPPLYLFFFF